MSLNRFDASALARLKDRWLNPNVSIRDVVSMFRLGGHEEKECAREWGVKRKLGSLSINSIRADRKAKQAGFKSIRAQRLAAK